MSSAHLFAVVAALLALPLLPRAASAQPLAHADRVQELITRGHTLEQRGDPTSAIAFYRDAVAAGPRDARGYTALGRCYLALSEWARALEVFEAGTVAAGSDPHLSWGVFEARQGLGKTAEAIDALREVLAHAPNDAQALRALAELSAELGRWSAALAATRALIALEPEPGSDRAQLALRARALELVLGAAERTRARPCPASTAVLGALARCP